MQFKFTKMCAALQDSAPLCVSMVEIDEDPARTGRSK